MKYQKSEYKAFGKKYLGPFLYAYTSWLYEKIASDGMQKIFFFARDGYLMEKAFQLFVQQKNGNITAQYVYFSRNSIRRTLLWRCGSYHESLKYMSATRFISLGGILEYYGFSKEEREKIAIEYELKLSEEFQRDALVNNARLEKLYTKLKKRINRKSYEQDVLLKQYIEQIGMSGRCAIVDIGWLGRMQQYVELYFENCNIPLECIGYYIGIQTIVPVKGTVRGFLYDNEQTNLRKSVSCFLGGYEKLFQSREGSTYGYKSKNGKIEIVFSPYEYQEQPEIQENIQAWQDAALDYVQKALEEGLPSNIAMAMPLIHLGKYPRLKDIQLFSFLCNDDGKKDYFVSQKSLIQYRPKELIYALSNSTWKTGFMRSLFKIPLPYYILYCLLRK